MDISNNQKQLFSVINRSYMMDGQMGKPVEDGVEIKNYLDRVQKYSEPYEVYSQLDNITHLGTLCKQNSQRSKLPNPAIYSYDRGNETKSRFNYAIDRQVDRKLIDVSGQEIPNERLRNIPNTGGVVSCYQQRKTVRNPEIEQLSNEISKISILEQNDLNIGDLQFKASRQRLSREELLLLNNNRTFVENRIANTIKKMKNKPVPRGRSSVISKEPTAKKSRRQKRKDDFEQVMEESSVGYLPSQIESFSL